jgi:hypothetical protein
MFTVEDLAKVYGITVRQVEFYMLVGLCIKEWSKVEERLFRFCALILGSDDEKAAIVYSRTPSIEGRLKLADELVRSILPERDKKDGGHDHLVVREWSTIQKEITKLLSMRNFLAHAPVEQKLHSSTPDDPVLRTTIMPDGTKMQILRSVEVMWVKTAEHERKRGREDHRVSDSSLHHHLRTVRAVAERLHVFYKEQAEVWPLRRAPIRRPRRDIRPLRPSMRPWTSPSGNPRGGS